MMTRRCVAEWAVLAGIVAGLLLVGLLLLAGCASPAGPTEPVWDYNVRLDFGHAVVTIRGKEVDRDGNPAKALACSCWSYGDFDGDGDIDLCDVARYQNWPIDGSWSAMCAQMTGPAISARAYDSPCGPTLGG